MRHSGLESLYGHCSVAGNVEGSLRDLYNNAARQACQQGIGQFSPATITQPTQATKPINSRSKSMFSEVATDVKSFIMEHRSILYFLAIALILDHLLFKDAFRHRLQSMADKIVTKVEEKITK